MSKWADYAIVAVQFKEEKIHIKQVKIREDTGDKLGDEQIKFRERIVEAIEKGITFITAYKQNGTWNKGNDVGIINIGGQKFIRTDRNNIAKDNLGELPEFE